MSKSPEVQEWQDFDGDPNSPFQMRSFHVDGMDHVDPKYVVMRDERTGAPLVAINWDDMRISWDPDVIDSETIKSLMRKALEQTEREEHRKNKGFGY